jgi:hypothetical protein
MGVCKDVSVYTTPATSPGISKHRVINSSFSTWTESRWGSGIPSSVVYKSGTDNEAVTAGAGIAIFFIRYCSILQTCWSFNLNALIFICANKVVLVSSAQRLFGYLL